MEARCNGHHWKCHELGGLVQGVGMDESEGYAPFCVCSDTDLHCHFSMATPATQMAR
jgi:hypothetical protein